MTFEFPVKILAIVMYVPIIIMKIFRLKYTYNMHKIQTIINMFTYALSLNSS